MSRGNNLHIKFQVLLLFVSFMTLSSQELCAKEKSFSSAIPQDSTLEAADHDKDLEKHIKKLSSKSREYYPYFLEQVFYKTHRKFLKRYEKGQTFSSLMNEGIYDCVTASILYSYILKNLEVDHVIIETDTHIFIVIRKDGKEYIFETTNPIDGLIAKETEVLSYIDSYKPGNFRQDADQPNTIYSNITFSELVGLQYYNVAVDALEKKQYDIADLFIDRAATFYQSERIRAFKNYVVAIK